VQRIPQDPALRTLPGRSGQPLLREAHRTVAAGRPAPVDRRLTACMRLASAAPRFQRGPAGSWHTPRGMGLGGGRHACQALIDPALHARGWTEDLIRREETAGASMWWTAAPAAAPAGAPTSERPPRVVALRAGRRAAPRLARSPGSGSLTLTALPRVAIAGPPFETLPHGGATP
jgi:hypothetical protein